MSIDLVAFLDEVFATLDAAAIGLNVPTDKGGVRAGPPAPYVELPEITYGEPGPGLDRITDLGITIVFGPANNVQVFRLALAYASPSGSKSVAAALQSHAWTSCGTVFVKSAEPSVETVQGSNPSIAYTFHLDITG